jgi:hypothetical protein
MGSLNASHANANALVNASANSRVGALATYGKAVQQGNLALAAQALAKASNKAVNAAMVNAVNVNMGLTSAFSSAMATNASTNTAPSSMASFVGQVNADRGSN